ncbi:hypothetical protein BKA80DRAFT_282597 [Phyllosticta citrichinensis]
MVAWHVLPWVAVVGVREPGRKHVNRRATTTETDRKRLFSAGTATDVHEIWSGFAGGFLVQAWTDGSDSGGRDWRRETGCGRGWAQRGHGSVGWPASCLKR